MTKLKALASNPKVQHIKLATFRKGKHKTADGWTSRSLRVLNAFVDDTGISFRLSERLSDNKFINVYSFRLRYFITKSGRPKFQFYRITANRVSLCTPLRIRDVISMYSTEGKISAAVVSRLRLLLKTFCKQKQYSITGLSKDPFELLLQLCYPGCKGFDSATLSTVSTSRYLLDDPVKLVLNSRGRKSKRLIMQAIKKYPAYCSVLFRVAHYLRTTRSLDAAQEFLDASVQVSFNRPGNQRILRSDYMLLSLTQVDEFGMYVYDRFQFHNLQSRYLKVFDAFSPKELASFLMYNHIYVRDFLCMYLNALGKSIDLSDMPKRQIVQMHDYVTNAVSEYDKQQKKLPPKPVIFDPEQENMIIAQAMIDQFNSRSANLVAAIPYDRATLTSFAEQMHNCATSYAPYIKQGNYIVIVIKSEDKCKYMLGFQLKNTNNIDYLQIELEQAVTYCNAPIEPDVLKDITSLMMTDLDVKALKFKVL